MDWLLRDYKGYYKEYVLEDNTYVLPVKVEIVDSHIEATPLLTGYHIDDLAHILGYSGVC